MPPEERAALLAARGDSLEAPDPMVSAEWNAEIERRSLAVEAGDSRLIAGDEVEARILEPLSQA